jgi:hypothetical protein
VAYARAWTLLVEDCFHSEMNPSTIISCVLLNNSTAFHWYMVLVSYIVRVSQPGHVSLLYGSRPLKNAHASFKRRVDQSSVKSRIFSECCRFEVKVDAT